MTASGRIGVCGFNSGTGGFAMRFTSSGDVHWATPDVANQVEFHSAAASSHGLLLCSGLVRSSTGGASAYLSVRAF